MSRATEHGRRPPAAAGVAAAVLLVWLETLLLFPLREVAQPASLGVVYLLGVLVVSIVWGAWLGVATSIASALAFNWFHLPPTGRLTISDGENWIALAVLLAAALVVSSLAEAVRLRAAEAEDRRRRADLAAELARVLLGAPDPQRGARSGGAADRAGVRTGLLPARARGRGRRRAHAGDPAGAGGRPARDPAGAARRAGDGWPRRRPALEALLAAALERDAIGRQVVETRALRRSDEIKTAVLRAVSHDLRSPVTAILASAEALATPGLADAERRELADGDHGRERAPRAPDRQADRALAPAGGRGRAAARLVLGRGGAARGGVGRCPPTGSSSRSTATCR